MYTLVINRNAFDWGPQWEVQSRYPCQSVQELIDKILKEHKKWTNYAIFETQTDGYELPITFGNETFEEIFKHLHPEDNE